uniref:DUF4407 domain-containing protein n=1 Tax=Candidatus Kentrum sp. FM TaxID=2126340 RepID=A0A450SL68_9GAMM|nr:MAG: hypothetical protein BECKFM1743A_GA0114220_101197 [Candidatus Kentron sp. FM]VFJ54306.1 MAG: hypothetical protein BECKFM1743C_GA0114222_101377 [Candidatus Kentron sp. FM]VFK10217.1 MAG: hypothetical protein BECKFM1743B_GA0114221_101338 [Candidatus Kentron sp. FM]
MNQQVTKIIPTLLLIISGVWSGFGVYTNFAPFDETKAIILGAGFSALGIIVSTVLSYYGFYIRRGVSILRSYIVAGIIAAMWLIFSPAYNAFFVCAEQAVKTEINSQFKKLSNIDKISKQNIYIEDVFFPLLKGLVAILDKEAQKQIEEHGGCGPICRKFMAIEEDISSIIELAEISRKKSKVDIQEHIGEIRALINTNQYGVLEIIERFSKHKNVLAESAPGQADKYTSLLLSFGEEVSKFREHIDYFSQMETRAKQTKQKGDIEAAKAALQVKRKLELIMKQWKIIKKRVSTVDAERVLEDLDGIEDVLLNFKLIFKHAGEYLSLIFVSFLVDIIALLMLFIPIKWYSYSANTLDKEKRDHQTQLDFLRDEFTVVAKKIEDDELRKQRLEEIEVPTRHYREFLSNR